jgi:hypothetical protein
MVTERDVNERLWYIVQRFWINIGDRADLLQRFDRMMTELNSLREAIAKE